MTKMTRRSALLGTAAATGLAACGQTATPSSSNLEEGSKTPMTNAPTTDNWQDGTAMAAKIASGETSAHAEVADAIARAKTMNADLNFIANDSFEEATQTAGETASGPFQGVPTFIKDLAHWKGAQTMFGSRAFKGFMPPEDSAFVASWRRAGMVSLGKSTTPEMGLTSCTEPLVTGATRNPWDTDRIPGGSSGGAAALVAARVVPFAHASDGGGSIRIPASTCGVFGLKPSRGQLYSRGMDAPPPVDISVNNSVSISVRDSISLFRVAQVNDGKFAPLGDLKPLTKKLRIGVMTKSETGSTVAPETTAAIEDVASLCADLGHEVSAFAPPFDGNDFADKFLLLWAAGATQFAQDASRFSGKPIGPEILEPWTLGLMNMFTSRQGDLPAAIASLQAFEAEYAAWFDTIDVLLSPVTGSPAVPIGEQAPDGDFDAVRESVETFAAFTAPMNVSGGASMSVPLSWSPSGLPIGSMFSGKIGDDALLFELALQLEAARPWADIRPPLSAF